MPRVLFGKTPVDKKPPPDYCFEWAQRLRALVKEKWSKIDKRNWQWRKHLPKTYSKTAWAREFLKLKRRLEKEAKTGSSRTRIYTPFGGGSKTSRKKQAKQRIENALSWYEKNIDEKYTPKSFFAASFCKKFDRLENAMKRSLDTSLKLSEKGEFWTKRIGRFWWPDLAKKQLPFVIQASLNAILSFRLKVEKYIAMNGLDDRKRPDPDDKLRCYAKFKVLNYITNENLIEHPLESLFHRNCDRLGWDGDLTREIVDTTSDRFREFGRSISSAKLWDEFYTEMEETLPT